MSIQSSIASTSTMSYRVDSVISFGPLSFRRCTLRSFVPSAPPLALAAMSRSVPVASSLSASPRPLRGASHFFGVAEDDALTAAVADCGAAGPRLAYWTRVQCRMAAVGFNRRPIGFKQRYERITERNNTWCAAPRRIATQSNAATATSQSDEAIIAGSDDDDDRRSASPMEKSGMSATSDDDEMNGGRSSAAFDCLLHAALPPDDSIDDPDNAPMCAILSSLSSSTDQLSALRRAVDAMDVSFSLSRANMVHEIAALRSSNLLLHASSESAAATIAHRDGRIAQLLMQVGEAVGIIATSNAVIEAQRAKIDEYKRDAELLSTRHFELIAGLHSYTGRMLITEPPHAANK